MAYLRSLALLCLLQGLLMADSIVVFNEVMFHPRTDEANQEWIEFHNQNAVDVDISGWHLSGAVRYEFPIGTIIRGRGYLVVANNPSALGGSSGAQNVLGPFDGRLSNSGERVILTDRNNRVMDELDYEVGGLWPTSPDGTGLSLAKADPNAGSEPASSWRASLQVGGTPGTRNFPSAAFEAPAGLSLYLPFNETAGTTSARDLLTDTLFPLTGNVQRQPGPIGSGSLLLGQSPAQGQSVNLGLLPTTTLASSNGISFEAVLKSTWDGTGRSTLFFREQDRAGSLTAYWNFDEGNQGTNAATELLSGTPALARSTVVRTNGIRGTGAFFFKNGNAEAVAGAASPSNAFVFREGITLSAWILPRWNGNSNNTEIIFSKDDSTNRVVMSLQFDNNNNAALIPNPPGPVLSFGLNIGGYVELDMPLDGQNGRLSMAELTNGTPHHVLGTFDSISGEMALWVDGTKRTSATRSGVIRSGGNAQVFIGNRNTAGSAAFTGTIDDVALWKTALDVASIQALHAGTSPLTLQPITGQGNRVYLGLRNVGDTDFTDPPVQTIPSLFFGLNVSGTYRELEWRLDGNEGRPTLAQLQDGLPHVLAAGHDPESGQMWVAWDGSVRATLAASGVPLITGVVDSTLANRAPGLGETFAGTLDEFTIWNRSLRPAELATHAAAVARGAHYFDVFDPAQKWTVSFSEIPPAALRPFWIEIVNHGGAALDLTQLQLTRSGNGGSETSLPSVTLNPGQRIVLNQAQLGFTPRNGDKIWLETKDRTGILDAAVIRSSSQARTESLGAWRTPNPLTPGAANTIATPAGVVINEVMYHAPPQYPKAAEYNNPADVILPFDAVWRFNAAGQNLGTNWRSAAFSDTEWSQGRGLFYNETATLPAPVNTSLPLGPITYYFRTTFQFTNPSPDTQISFRTLIDDGAVVYLNGVELVRTNMRSGNITYTNFSTTTVNNATIGGPFTIRADQLLPGENLLAVEVHQSAANSDDVVFGLELSVLTPSKPAQPYLENPEQWIEIHNPTASTVDLAGWQITDAVGFVFGPDSTLAPGGFIVVARDPVTLKGKYPGITIVGPWDGRLRNGGEEIVLRDPSGNPADSVRYYNGGYWPGEANGGGSSLELRQARSNHRLPSSWAASRESHKASWQQIRYQGRGREQPSGAPPDVYQELVIGMLDNGEVLLDDIQVSEVTATNTLSLVQNSTFETDMSKWRVLGNHTARRVTDPDNPANHVMHLIATGATEHMHNHLETTLKDGTRSINLSDSKTYEISLRARWVSGSPQLNTRLFFNRLPRTTILDMPQAWGTPGRTNSTAVENLGPGLAQLQHSPVVPPAQQPVTVSVDAEDADGVESCRLFWTLDGKVWNGSAMSLDSSADTTGRWSGQIPGQARGEIVQFYVEARDQTGNVSVYPPDGPASRALIQFQDNQANLKLAHNFRIILTDADTAVLFAQTNLMSNGRIGATIVYDEQEVAYDCGIRLKGSEHGRPNNLRIGFNIDYPTERPFRGVHDTIALDRSGGWRFGTVFGQDEILINHVMYRVGGLPAMYNDLVRIIGPRSEFTGSAMLQMSRYGPLFLDAQFENGSSSPVFEYELYYGQSAQIPAGPEGFKVPQEGGVTGYALGRIGESKEQHRLGYIMKNGRDADAYEPLMKSLELFGLTGNAFLDRADDVLDVDQWLRAIAVAQLCGANDNYSGSGSGHNVQFYVRPSDGKLLHLLWDTDFAFQIGATDSIVNNPELTKLLTRPAYARKYYGHVLDIITSTYNADYMAYWVDHYDNFTPGQNFSDILNYIRTRSATARSALPRVAPFNASGANTPLLVNSGTATVTGTAWINVSSIQVAGQETPLSLNWTTQSNWNAQIPVQFGSNVFVLVASDLQQKVVTNLAITVISSDPTAGSDSDQDGMPDLWETINDLNPSSAADATRDQDRDGLSNYEEYLAGTDPRSVSSKLQIRSVTPSSEGTQVEFDTVVGRTYSVQARDSLDAGSWKNVGQYGPNTINQTLTVLDAQPSGPQRFYRVVTPAVTQP